MDHRSTPERETILPIESFDETLIVAENDPQMRGLLRAMLQQPGRLLLLCADGTEAVEFATHTVVNLVLLDLRMPRMDGIEACRRIRALPRYRSVPIAIQTVFNDETFRRRASRAGANVFLSKPISRDQLLQAVNPLITAHKQTLELGRH